MPKERLNLVDKINGDEKNLYNGQLVYVAIGWKQEVIAIGILPDKVYGEAVIRGCVCPIVVQGTYYKLRKN